MDAMALRAEGTAEARPAGKSLRPGQQARLVVIGAVLWFLAALLLRALGPMGVHEGWARVALYVLVVPGTVPFILLTKRIAGLRRDQIALGYAVATAAAALLDGIALAWFPGLYGAEVAHQAGAGAAILWGAGVGLALGVVMNQSERS